MTPELRVVTCVLVWKDKPPEASSAVMVRHDSTDPQMATEIADVLLTASVMNSVLANLVSKSQLHVLWLDQLVAEKAKALKGDASDERAPGQS